MERENLQLIERARQGDTDAFNRCVQVFAPRVNAVAYQMTGNSEDARDITQEVFVRLFHALDSYDPAQLFWTWLYRVTVNLAIDFKRRNARHRHESLDGIAGAGQASDSATPPDVQAERQELRGAISRLLKKLSAKQQQVFVLRDLQGLSTAEIARILECNTSTIRVHLARARKQIKDALIARYPEYAGGKNR